MKRRVQSLRRRSLREQYRALVLQRLDLSDAHIAWHDEKGLVGSTPDVIVKAVVEVQTTCQPRRGYVVSIVAGRCGRFRAMANSRPRSSATPHTPNEPSSTRPPITCCASGATTHSEYRPSVLKIFPDGKGTTVCHLRLKRRCGMVRLLPRISTFLYCGDTERSGICSAHIVVFIRPTHRPFTQRCKERSTAFAYMHRFVSYRVPFDFQQGAVNVPVSRLLRTPNAVARAR